jgi:peptide/nickel transport system substrate-binding protein
VTNQPSDGASPAWVKEGKSGGHIDWFHAVNPELWDTHRGATVHTIRPTRSLYNGLLTYNAVPPMDLLVGDLAKSWELADDGVTYTFQLHEGVKWSDGQPFTPEDVVFSLDRMVAEGEPRPRTGALRAYYESSRVIDPNTVEVTTQFPSSAFLSFVGADYMVMMPKHVLEAGVDINLAENIVGTGPFLQAGFERGSSYSFDRNPDYFKDGLPFLDSAKVFVISDKGRAIAAMLTEQVLANIGWSSGLNSDQVTALAEQSGGKIKARSTLLGPAGLFLNFNVKPFDDPKVRKAVYLALDRKELSDSAYSGLAANGRAFAPGVAMSDEEVSQWPGHRYVDADGVVVTDPFTRDDVVKDPRDIEEARSLMDQAGYGDGVDVTFMYRNLSTYPVEAPFLKDQLADIGMNLQLEAVESATGLARYAEGDYQMGRITHGVSIRDADEIFTSIYLPGGSRNQLGYEDPRILEIFNLQAREQDPVKRVELLKEAEEIINQGEYHWPNILWVPTFQVTNVKVRNHHEPITIHLLNSLEHIWLDPDATTDTPFP